MTIDADRAAEAFAAATDLTVGLEEEFALLDADTLDLVPRFEELRDTAAADDPLLSESIAGELISSEIEIRSGRGEDLADAARAPARPAPRACSRSPPRAASRSARPARTRGPTTASSPTSTPSTTAGSSTACSTSRGATTRSRCTSTSACAAPTAPSASATACAPVLPLLLAISANSPYVDARDSGLHSARSQTFTKSFPRCGIPDSFGSWAAYSEYIDFLIETDSIVEYTQVWWSIRPHFSFGTVEVRICDAQSTAQEAEALAGADRRVRRAGRARRGRARAVRATRRAA